MPAYQFTITGLLDGATAFAAPDPMPEPTDGGVIKIAVPGNFGSISLNDFGGSINTPMWLRAVQAEFAGLTRSARFTTSFVGSQVSPRLVPDQVSPPPGNGAPLMRIYSLTRNPLTPLGATDLIVLSDTTTTVGGGAPVAGPHVLFLDLEPVIDDEQLGLVHGLQANAALRGHSQGYHFTSGQRVAATETVEQGPVVTPSTASSAGLQAKLIQVTTGAQAAAGESMLIEVNVRSGATVVLLGSTTVTNAVAANATISVPVIQQVNNLSTGDVVQVVRTYVAGGGPAPMTNTVVMVELEPVTT